MKFCSHCKQKLLNSDFSSNKSRPTGLSDWCKICDKKHKHVYYEKNKSIILMKSKLYRLNPLHKEKHYLLNSKLRQHNYKIIKDLKLNGCSICGYNRCTKALDFHHVEPKIKKFYVVADNIQREDLIEELGKCILLCANCHREIHQKGRSKEI